MLFKIAITITLLSVGYILLKFILDILLRGFAPLIPSRPWVVEATLNNLKLGRYRRAFALGSGRSGFIYSFGGMYPDTELVAVEQDVFPSLVARAQLLVRKLIKRPIKIKLMRSSIRRVDLSKANLIYSHLYPEQMDNLGSKLKFECRPGITVVSNGFMIPGLEPKKIVDLPKRKGRLAWLSRDKGLIFRSKRKKSKKENRVFFYEI